jgi:hypothetical protein
MKGVLKTSILTAALAFTLPVALRAQDAADTVTTKNIQMVSARAMLGKGIDAKKAKQGDAITAKIQDDVKIPGSVDLPRNTVLLGHIDQVQPSENKGDSSVQVTFDKAQLKNGQQLAIKATIMQISAPPSALRNQEGASPGGPAPMPSAPISSSGGGPSGGGMQPQQSVPRPTSSTMPSAAPDSSQPSGQPTGIAGVQLQSDINQSNSALFTSKKKNVHLDDGTQLQIGIAVIPPNTQTQ